MSSFGRSPKETQRKHKHLQIAMCYWVGEWVGGWVGGARAPGSGARNPKKPISPSRPWRWEEVIRWRDVTYDRCHRENDATKLS